MHASPCVNTSHTPVSYCAIVLLALIRTKMDENIWQPYVRTRTQVYGKDQPIALQLLGSERSYEALEGVAMELEDSLYPLLRSVRTRAAVPAARAFTPSASVLSGARWLPSMWPPGCCRGHACLHVWHAVCWLAFCVRARGCVRCSALAAGVWRAQLIGSSLTR